MAFVAQFAIADGLNVNCLRVLGFSCRGRACPTRYGLRASTKGYGKPYPSRTGQPQGWPRPTRFWVAGRPKGTVSRTPTGRSQEAGGA